MEFQRAMQTVQADPNYQFGFRAMDITSKAIEALDKELVEFGPRGRRSISAEDEIAYNRQKRRIEELKEKYMVYRRSLLNDKPEEDIATPNVDRSKNRRNARNR